MLDACGIDVAVDLDLDARSASRRCRADEARPLLDAYHRGIAEIVERLGRAAAGVRGGLPGRGRRRRRGCRPPARRGLRRPARCPARRWPRRPGSTAARPCSICSSGRGRPLFVHPGPAPWTRPEPGRPAPARLVDAARPVPGVVAAGVRDLACARRGRLPDAAGGVRDHGRRRAVPGGALAHLHRRAPAGSTRTSSSTQRPASGSTSSSPSPPTAPSRSCSAPTSPSSTRHRSCGRSRRSARSWAGPSAERNPARVLNHRGGAP